MVGIYIYKNYSFLTYIWSRKIKKSFGCLFRRTYTKSKPSNRRLDAYTVHTDIGNLIHSYLTNEINSQKYSLNGTIPIIQNKCNLYWITHWKRIHQFNCLCDTFQVGCLCTEQMTKMYCIFLMFPLFCMAFFTLSKINGKASLDMPVIYHRQWLHCI